MADKTSQKNNGQIRSPIPVGPFDLVVVGGGINGAAIARDAVLRGLTVCLCEKADFAYGSSSRSSKMLHGGLRYLEQFHFGLVFEALRERTLQLRLAPHLTRPLGFVIPVYEGSRRGLRWIRLGVWLYGLLATGRRLGKGQTLSIDEITNRVPGLKTDALLGGGLYFDGIMNDARLCLANMLDAREAASPGQLCLRSYTEVTSIKETVPVELELHDRLLGTSTRVLANRVVRAVGPWADGTSGSKTLLAPSKGIHIVVPPIETAELGPHGLLLTHSRDGRVFFIVPWEGKSVVGTTETPVNGSPDTQRAEPEEVLYLLNELRALFPGRHFSPNDILGAFSGVRPLARASSFRGALGKVSRVHRLVETGPGIFTLVGGKYTTYRSIAKKVVDQVAPGTKSVTHLRPLAGGESGGWSDFSRREGRAWIKEFGGELVERLFHRYGTRLVDILERVHNDATLGEPLTEHGPEIRAEVVHSIIDEEVYYPADFLERRTAMRFQRGNGRDAYEAIQALIVEQGAAYGRVPPDLDQARQRFLDELAWEDSLRDQLA
jgi:glycerol-3-phosphate dehydrogenase